MNEELRKLGFSKREAEVAIVVAKGRTNKEAGSDLFVTEKTIKFHLTNIYKKAKINSRTQLSLYIGELCLTNNLT